MSQYTPKPWEEDSRWPKCLVSPRAYLPGALSLARVAEIHYAKPADLRLMQAAPDLLEALTELLAYVERSVTGGRTIAEMDRDGEQVPEVRHARDAISKATDLTGTET